MTDTEFEYWVRTYGDTIYRVARHALSHPADAEDVVQTVLLRLYRTDTIFQSADHVKHWLIRVTVNECRRTLSAPWRRRTVPLEDWDGPAPDPSPDGDVLAAVLALEPKYRMSIYLYYYEGCTVKEVAQALRAKESTVQTWLQRAREKLRLTLSESREEGSGYVRPELLP